METSLGHIGVVMRSIWEAPNLLCTPASSSLIHFTVHSSGSYWILTDYQILPSAGWVELAGGGQIEEGKRRMLGPKPCMAQAFTHLDS